MVVQPVPAFHDSYTSSRPTYTWLALPGSKNSMLVVLGVSTSVKIAPNPFVVAGAVVPGTKKLTSVTLLPSAVNSRGAEKVLNAVEYVGSMFPKLAAAGCPGVAASAGEPLT